MNVIQTRLPDVLLLEPKVFGDARGFFFESFNANAFRQATGFDGNFVQNNHSRSAKGVLRGLHYQIQNTQGKIVRVIRGEVFDVAVDMRKGSPTFGQWDGFTLSAENFRSVWIPPGFAHGFVALSDVVEMTYKATDFYAPQFERSLLWNDPTVAIDWPLDRLDGAPLLSPKDAAGLPFAQCEVFP